MSVFIQCLYSRGDARVSEETEKAVMCACMNESVHQLVIATRGGGVTGRTVRVNTGVKMDGREASGEGRE